MRKSLWLFLVAVVVATAAPVAWAQIANGDFEDGGSGWGTEVPAGWTVTFPATGGMPDGYARIQSPFGDSEGMACVSQTFECGIADEGDVCRISFDFKLDQIDASDNTGFAVVMVDDVSYFGTPPGQSIPWTSIEITRPCGTHTIELCLLVEAGNHGWAACYDNVSAVCEPGVSQLPSTWSEIKSLYGH